MTDKYLFRKIECGLDEVKLIDGEAVLVNCWADMVVENRIEKVVVHLRITKHVIDEIIRKRVKDFLKIP